MTAHIFGDKNVLAIECECTSTIDDWVYGRILLWVRGEQVGNPEDAADLKGCRSWLREFVEEPRNRFEKFMKGQTPEKLFALLHEPVMAGGSGLEATEDAFARFNIGHLGMSSFDRYDILLVEDPEAGQRLLWREGDGAIQHAYLPANSIQSVASECLHWMTTAF